MKVSIKNLQVSMDLRNNGIELDIYDNQGKHLGDIKIGKATVEWCEGKTRLGNGKQKSWDQLITWFKS